MQTYYQISLQNGVMISKDLQDICLKKRKNQNEHIRQHSNVSKQRRSYPLLKVIYDAMSVSLLAHDGNFNYIIKNNIKSTIQEGRRLTALH